MVTVARTVLLATLVIGLPSRALSQQPPTQPPAQPPAQTPTQPPAQTQPPADAGLPDKFVNLQVLPKETRPDLLIATMKNFARALGVRCQFCHVGKEGQPLSEFNFASDDNPNKEIARNMIRMSGVINSRLQKDIPGAFQMGYQVTCYTCHRGAEHPVHSPDTPKPPGN